MPNVEVSAPPEERARMTFDTFGGRLLDLQSGLDDFRFYVPTFYRFDHYGETYIVLAAEDRNRNMEVTPVYLIRESDWKITDLREVPEGVGYPVVEYWSSMSQEQRSESAMFAEYAGVGIAGGTADINYAIIAPQDVKDLLSEILHADTIDFERLGNFIQDYGGYVAQFQVCRTQRAGEEWGEYLSVLRASYSAVTEPSQIIPAIKQALGIAE